MADLLLYGDIEHNAALRHEVPIAIGDPFLYAEVGERVLIMASNLERDRLAATRPDPDLIDIAERRLSTSTLRSRWPSGYVQTGSS